MVRISRHEVLIISVHRIYDDYHVISNSDQSDRVGQRYTEVSRSTQLMPASVSQRKASISILLQNVEKVTMSLLLTLIMFAKR